MICEGNDSTGATVSSLARAVQLVALGILVVLAGIPGVLATGMFERIDPGERMPADADPTRNAPQMLSDPWVAALLIEPGQLARVLSDPKAPKPLIFHIGPTVLYRAGHVPGARLIGPTVQASGIGNLERQLNDLPKDSDIVLYCGCCPWEDCPNIRPAFMAARKMGFTKLKILHLSRNFKQDWTDKNFPTQRGE